MGAWGQGRLPLTARRLPGLLGPVCPLARHGTERARTSALRGPAGTAASEQLPGLHQKPQSESGRDRPTECLPSYRPEPAAAVPGKPSS